MKIRMFVAVALAVLVGLALPRSTPAADSSSIYATLEVMKDHTILFVAVTEAQEAAALKKEGALTLFAPTDSAFLKLGNAAVKKLGSDNEMVKQLLQSHLVQGIKTTARLKELDGMDLPTLRGNSLKVEDTKDGLRVGGAKLVTTDIVCNNGVIHVIDAVLPVTK